MLLRKHHPKPAKVQRVVFLCLKCYLQNENTNVSNAKMNIPKAIRSLKSKCFISTTPILCRIEVIHPVTRLFLDGSLTHFILYFNILELYFVIHLHNFHLYKIMYLATVRLTPRSCFVCVTMSASTWKISIHARKC